MKPIFSIALLALTTTTTLAWGQSYNNQYNRQGISPDNGSCWNKDLNRDYDRYDVGYNTNPRDDERRVQDWRYDDNSIDNRFGNDRYRDDYTDRYGDRYDSRYNDRFNSRYDSRPLSGRRNYDLCADGRCDINGCPNGQCANDDCADGQCRVTPVGYRGICKDGTCPIDAPHRAHRSGNMGPGSGGRFDSRFRVGDRDDFNSGRDFRAPLYNRSGSVGINWTTSLQQAADIAARENLPLLVQVTSSNCRFCQQMKREAFAHTDVIGLLNRSYVTVQVDADQERTFIDQMKITSLPTTLIVAPNRQILERVEGARSAAQLLELLHRNRSAELDTRSIVTASR